MKKHHLLLIGVILHLFSCSSIKVTTDYDKSADFGKYKTYVFLGWQGDSEKILNDFDKDRLRKAFAEEFEKRNLELVKENGDIAVTLFVVVDQESSITGYTNYYGNAGYGYGRGWGWGGGHSTTTYTESDYLKGTLVVDVFDGQSKELVWQGVGTKTIEENPQKRDKNIPKGAEAIMKSFPILPLDD